MTRVLALAAVAALLLGVAEIAVFTMVAHAIGVLWTLLLVIATSLLGGWALRRQGVRGWRRFRATVAEGRPPGPVATQGLLGLLAALLLAAPGFITDVVGLVLLVPPVRALAGHGVRRVAERRVSPVVAGDLFGPRRVRVRRSAARGGTPAQPPPPPPPTAAVESGVVEDSVVEGEVVEGEVVDRPRGPEPPRGPERP